MSVPDLILRTEVFLRNTLQAQSRPVDTTGHVVVHRTGRRLVARHVLLKIEHHFREVVSPVKVAMLHIKEIILKPPADKRVGNRCRNRTRLQKQALHGLTRQDRGEHERLDAERLMAQLESVTRRARHTSRSRRRENSNHQNTDFLGADAGFIPISGRATGAALWTTSILIVRPAVARRVGRPRAGRRKERLRYAARPMPETIETIT